MSAQPLSGVPAGRYRCTGLMCAGDAELQLKRMGFCEGRLIEVVRRGNPLLLRVVNTDVGVSASLAKQVLVEQVLTEEVSA